eukprot:CAMPEP_0179257794 /NCGR_PEP_ID=MMETSP0797-20121207/24975_1 /TAXON_ID=47934 /ORGANISM="Dinophysis acuminata, Strain DAEP01" /LENGTH=257 /DNA_ID=CAMNT_0020965789 /DNA_START=32 /DNA_END=803 /DNA_ORIENTATION=+
MGARGGTKPRAAVKAAAPEAGGRAAIREEVPRHTQAAMDRAGWPNEPDHDPAAAMMAASSALFIPPPVTVPMPGDVPKVLLLSESIPPHAPAEREKRDGRLKNGQINQMKDNKITKKEPPWTDVTTVMMRNLPNKYTQQMLLEEIHDGGFRLQHDFDFFYLPMDHSNAANLGYCFINFVETALANAFAAAYQGKKMRRFNSNKTVVVMPASVQGFERNYAYYASTRVAHAEDPQYRPLFLKQPHQKGWQSVLPVPLA